MGPSEIRIFDENNGIPGQCDDHDPEKTQSAVRHSVDLLGGIGSFIRPGERVLIKPNLLRSRPPADAVTTHPEIVRAVIRLVHHAGRGLLWATVRHW